jgi:hypothetical protein
MLFLLHLLLLKLVMQGAAQKKEKKPSPFESQKDLGGLNGVFKPTTECFKGQ